MTRSGWLLAAAAVGLLVLGRLLGLTDLFLFGAVLGCLVLACLVWVFSHRPLLEVTRHLHPSRVSVGSQSRVELTIANLGHHRSPVMALRDPVSGTAGAEILLAPLAPGQEISSTYHLPTTRRGLLQVGPLEVRTLDPFGLTRLVRRCCPLVEVTVLPHIDPLDPPPVSSGDDPHGGHPRSHQAGRSSDEFHALRPYVVGDDLRRVHWASTARSGELMVRHDEAPWQGRTTVLVDLRRGGDLLEIAISAAASVLVAAWRRGDLVRLVTTGGSDTGFASSHAELDAVMEHLALADVVPAPDLGGVGHLLDRSSPGGLVALLTTSDPRDLSALACAQAAFPTVTTVAFDPSPSPAVGVPEPGRTRLLRVGADQSFAEVWNQLAAVAPTGRKTAYGLAST